MSSSSSHPVEAGKSESIGLSGIVVSDIIPLDGSPDAKFSRITMLSRDAHVRVLAEEKLRLETFRRDCLSATEAVFEELHEFMPSSTPLSSSPPKTYASLISGPQTSTQLIHHKRTTRVSEAVLMDNADVEYIPYVDRAMELLEAQTRRFEAKVGESVNAATAPKSSAAAARSNSGTSTPISISEGSTATSAGGASAVPTTTTAEMVHLFYQSSGVRMVFLHPICLKCILTHHRNAATAVPDHLDSRVIELEHLRVDDAARQRIPFLRHLPRHCDVILVEIELKGLVSSDCLELFAAELAKRAKRRKERQVKAKKEKKQDKAAR
jgi:hypothetical protein